MQTMRICRIPAIRTASYVSCVVALTYLALTLLKGAPAELQDKNPVDVLMTAALGSICVAVACWIITSVTFAIYNKLSRKFGGIQFEVSIDGENVQPSPGHVRK